MLALQVFAQALALLAGHAAPAPVMATLAPGVGRLPKRRPRSRCDDHCQHQSDYLEHVGFLLPQILREHRLGMPSRPPGICNNW